MTTTTEGFLIGSHRLSVATKYKYFRWMREETEISHSSTVSVFEENGGNFWIPIAFNKQKQSA
ncbi:hypothetical protein C5167_029796 [Papaver somniferum]|nr:hypothetical protein C5167_029796 [Papaver somniferum]